MFVPHVESLSQLTPWKWRHLNTFVKVVSPVSVDVTLTSHYRLTGKHLTKYLRQYLYRCSIITTCLTLLSRYLSVKNPKQTNISNFHQCFYFIIKKFKSVYYRNTLSPLPYSTNQIKHSFQLISAYSKIVSHNYLALFLMAMHFSCLSSFKYSLL